MEGLLSTGLIRIGPKLQMGVAHLRYRFAPGAADSGILGQRQHGQTNARFHIAADHQHTSVAGVHFNHDVAMRRGIHAERLTRICETAILRAGAGIAQQIAGIDRCLTEVKGDKGRVRRRTLACADRLIDISDMFSRVLKLCRIAQTCLAHHP